ncbi:DUF1758 domain-containing protein [Trichonephila clavipes]|nr:DUF1758 domain-containing protein [Trichonephila clavipes]
MSTKLAWELNIGDFASDRPPDRIISSCTSALKVTFSDTGTVGLAPHGLLSHRVQFRSTVNEFCGNRLQDWGADARPTQRIPINPRECLNSFKNAVKSSGETYIQFAARLTANFQYYCSLRKVNSFESLCDLIISDKLFETLNKETATHIGIREAEDWFRPIDLAKECDIYISS